MNWRVAVLVCLVHVPVSAQILRAESSVALQRDNADVASILLEASELSIFS